MPQRVQYEELQEEGVATKVGTYLLSPRASASSVGQAPVISPRGISARSVELLTSPRLSSSVGQLPPRSMPNSPRRSSSVGQVPPRSIPNSPQIASQPVEQAPVAVVRSVSPAFYTYVPPMSLDLPRGLKGGDVDQLRYELEVTRQEITGLREEMILFTQDGISDGEDTEDAYDCKQGAPNTKFSLCHQGMSKQFSPLLCLALLMCVLLPWALFAGSACGLLPSLLLAHSAPDEFLDTEARLSLTRSIDCRQLNLTGRTGCTRRLTNLYLELRFVNNVSGLVGLFSPNATMSLDLSEAGFLVSMRVNMAAKFRSTLSGPQAIAGFYRSLPTEPSDIMPANEDIKCSEATCTVTAQVTRTVVGRVQDVGTFEWDLAKKQLQRVAIAFSLL